MGDISGDAFRYSYDPEAKQVHITHKTDHDTIGDKSTEVTLDVIKSMREKPIDWITGKLFKKKWTRIDFKTESGQQKHAYAKIQDLQDKGLIFSSTKAITTKQPLKTNPETIEKHAKEIAGCFDKTNYTKLLAIISSLEDKQIDISECLNKAAEKTQDKTTFSLLMKQFDAIKGIDKKVHGLDPYNILRILVYAQKAFKEAKEHDPNIVYSKKNAKNQLPRSLIINREKQLVSILSKDKVDVLHAEGAFTKITSTIDINVKTGEVTVGTQGVSKDTVSRSDKKGIESKIAFGKEVQKRGCKYLVGIETSATYTKTKGEATTPKTTYIQEKFDSDLVPFTYVQEEVKTRAIGTKKPIHPRQDLSFDDKLCVLENLSYALSEMHSTMEFVHRDINLKNVLFRRDQYSEPLVKLTDFDQVQKIGEYPATFAYGTPVYASPEVLRGSGERDLKKEDEYAEGLVAYELILGKPAWFDKIDIKATYMPKAIQKNNAAALELQEQIATQIDTLETQNNGKLDNDDTLKLIILKHLHPDPTKRTTTVEFRHEINKLREKCLQEEIQKNPTLSDDFIVGHKVILLRIALRNKDTSLQEQVRFACRRKGLTSEAINELTARAGEELAL